MATLKIIVLIILVQSTEIINGIDTNYIPHVLENLSDFYRDHKVFTAPGLIYGTCDQTELLSNERRCSLALETSDSLKRDDEHLLLCNITLKSSEERGKVSRDFDFYALEGKKALLKWSNENSKDCYGIVDFSNCTVVYAKVDGFDIQSSYVAGANNQTIDVIVKNTKGEHCKSVICKLTLDLNGNVVEDMQEWFNSPYKFIALVKSPAKGHLAVDYTGSLNRTLRIFAVNDHGETDTIREFSANDDRLENAIKASTTYDLLTVCYALEENVTCAQFDINGTLKFEKILSPSDRLHSIKVHNMPGGGFILMTTDCIERVTDKCLPDCRGSYSWYLDAEGEFVGYLGIGGFQCPGGGFEMDKQHFFVNELQRLCYSDLCPNVRYDKQLALSVICFDTVEYH